MKNTIKLISVMIMLLSLLCACSKDRLMNIYLFTDNLNKALGEDLFSLESYDISGKSYALNIKNFLLTAEENSDKKIEKVRLTISKADTKGNIKSTSDEESGLFKETAASVIKAFCCFEKEDSEAILSSILPSCGKEYSKIGELKLKKDNYTFIFYSNDIGAVLMVSNDFLLPEKATEKPVSKPVYTEPSNLVN